MSNKIRVLIVDDSPFIRKALLRMFDTEPTIEVVGVARDGKEAIDKAEALHPDVITLDIMMPVVDGIQALSTIMKSNPTPVLMLSQLTKDGADLTFKALELGAMDFVDKSLAGYMNFQDLSKEIILKVRTIAGMTPHAIVEAEEIEHSRVGESHVDVVAIGASTGGPPALQMILQSLPAEITFGLLVVQHMPHGFTTHLAKRLDNICSIEVKEAEEGDSITPGLALIAPAGLHMMMSSNNKVLLDVEPYETVHKPSVDVLFNSVGERLGPRCMGVLLTGMGTDGAEGMAQIKLHGGFTIAQDQETSVIFGMPKAAIEAGAVDMVVPVTDMAKEILRHS